MKHYFIKALAHQGFKRYFVNTSWIFGETIFRMISGLLVGIWVARYLGPSQFGLFNYVLAYIAVLSGLAKLGLDNILIRELVKHPRQRYRYLGTNFWLKFIGALVALVALAISSIFTSNDCIGLIYLLRDLLLL